MKWGWLELVIKPGTGDEIEMARTGDEIGGGRRW